MMTSLSHGFMSKSLINTALVVVVGVLAATLFKLVAHPIESAIMTVSCAHKNSHFNEALMERDILPTNVSPIHYDLTITPDMTNFVFNGQVDIRLRVNEDTNEIQLNSKDLTIKSALVINGNEQIEASHSFDAQKETLTLTLSKTISKADHEPILRIDYTGIINDKMAGFYRSSYKDEQGVTRFMGATQFESTDARQALPCWDEPAVKSTFNVTLVVPKELTALSNMDIKEESEIENGLKKVLFTTTPVMSTYLLAWVIGDLESIETTNKNGVIVRVFATKGSVKQGHFALDVASKTLDFFTEYFDIPYPLPKMDMVAIPDFSAGAMENWGLVTYRTAYLLFDEENSSLKTKQNVAYVVGHELAHQWFGNLVTMEWWSDLWLNEGFATWVGWLAADHLFPEWDIWTEFVVDDCQAGLRLDGLRTSHPIEVPVKNPAEISQIFDSISYSKGASVIRMLVTYLGEETFKNGLRSYLKRHQYKNAKTEDLWTSLSEASGKSVNEIMAPWTRIMGYPVIAVSHDEGNGNKVEISQSRFLSSGDVKPEEDQVTWSIPLLLNEKIDGLTDLLVSKTATFNLPEGKSFVKFNSGQAGFYRVNYPSEWLKKIGASLKDGHLTASDRVGLISDAFSLSISGHLSLTSVLSLLQFFKDETDYLVWGEISGQLSQLLSIWWEQPSEDVDNLKKFIGSLYEKQVEILGFDFKADEPDKIKLLRPTVIAMAAKCGSERVIEEAKSRFSRFISGEHSAIHPNLRGTIYGIVIREGAAKEFEEVLKLYETFTVADQKLAALGALGFSRNPDVINRALELTKNDEIVRPQDVIYITRATGANPYGRRATWEYVQNNWNFYYNRYGIGGGISLLGRIVSTATQEFTDEKDAASVEKFFADKETATIDRTIGQSLERIRMNAKWLGSQRSSVAQWLRNKVQLLL